MQYVRCVRCNGYMYQERVYTHMGTLDVSVCVNCGNVVDDVILFNRIILPLNLEVGPAKQAWFNYGKNRYVTASLASLRVEAEAYFKM